MDTNNERENSFVKQIRRAKGFTQVQLAEAIGSSEPRIKAYERTNTLPSNKAVLQNLMKLADEAGIALEVPRDYRFNTTQYWRIMGSPLPAAAPKAKSKPNPIRERWLWEGLQAGFITKAQYRKLGGIYEDETVE